MLSIEIQPRAQGRQARAKPAPNHQPQSMASISRRKLRRAMQAREMALMGLSATQVAKALRITEKGAYNYANGYGFKYGKPESDLRKAVRAAYAEGGGGPRAAALASGTQYETVKALASQMGLTRPTDHYRFKRGFAVPDDRKGEYRALIRASLTPTEAGQIMGLIPREPTK